MSSPAATTGSPRQAPRRLGDLVASSVTRGAGVLILATLAGVAIFLAAKGAPEEVPITRKPGGSAVTRSPWLIQT